MQIGARTAAWAKSGGWVNPYVTDGLIGCYHCDFHGSDDTKWANLVDHDLFRDLDCSGVRWTDDGAIVGSNSSDYILGPKNSFENYSELSVEYVFKLQSFSYGNGIGWGSGGRALNSFAYITQDSNVSFAYYHHGYPPYLRIDGRNTLGDRLCVSLTASLSKTNPSLIAYRNSRSVGEIQTTYSNEFGNKYFVAGGWLTNGDFPYYAHNEFTVFALRFYNRIITQEEIAANYAIDKARFNIPDAA